MLDSYQGIASAMVNCCKISNAFQVPRVAYPFLNRLLELSRCSADSVNRFDLSSNPKSATCHPKSVYPYASIHAHKM